MKGSKPGRAELEERLGHRFDRPELLDCALTHASAARGINNQRLEFLGDRVLGLVVSELLYRAFPEAPEGELSYRLSELVRKESCALMAEEWQLASHLVLGSGQSRTSTRRNGAILADAAEAVIGAIYLDAGFAPAQALVQRTLGERLRASEHVRRDAKTALQEWAQADGRAVPDYAILDRQGPDHAPSFSVAVRVPGLAEAVGEGRSRRAAEQAAATALLVREGVWTEESAE